MLKLLKNPIFLFSALVFTAIFYISLSKTQQKNETTALQIKSIAEENQELVEKNTVLEEKLSSNNPEQMIRDEFLMKKEGEYVVKIPAPPVEIREEKEQPNQSNLQQWLSLIF
ncbi:hypothetical protein KJZ63_04835 [Patescibacteria group bacterium]|nr:hypothetical protein [Patescibacteria group bacterium]